MTEAARTAHDHVGAWQPSGTAASSRDDNAARLDAAGDRLAAALDGSSVFDGSQSAPPALMQLVRRFGLTAFERDLLLVAALLARDPALARRGARHAGDGGGGGLNFALARSLLAGADRLALSPGAALRRWRLLEPADGRPWVEAPLSLDERIQFYLEGHNYLDPRLEGLVRPLRAVQGADPEPARQAAAPMRGLSSPAHSPVIEIHGGQPAARLACAAAACASLGLQAWCLSAADIPAAAAEREAFARLWEREAMLMDAALVVAAPREAARAPSLRALLNSLEAFVLLCDDDGDAQPERSVWRVPLGRREPARERARWRAALGDRAARLGDQVDRAALQFQLDDDALAEVASAAAREADADRAATVLWESARRRSRQGLDGLAERIESRVDWTDLVLPTAQIETLQAIVLHARERHRVHESWGFASRGERGLGLCALFSGGSGTGKTLAAEVLAQALRLDLYRVDLARLVSKYIGETEKNLARVFDAAESGGAVLLFDEADALFGLRSEVRDSHDRYANIEVSYLLQRVESFRGLAILTTNMKQAIDAAFMRRLRFVVSFPFPDVQARSAIWSRVFPQAMPREGLDYAKLARLNVAGGLIRNIALGAAFIAAGCEEPVRMSHLRKAAEAEFAKLDKPLPTAEMGDWT